MKAKTFLLALEIVKGCVPSDKDFILLDTDCLIATDGVWGAQFKFDEKLDYMVLPFNRLYSAVKSIEGDSEVSLKQRNVDCVVTAPDVVWKLNLKNEKLPTFPSFGEPLFTMSGHQMLEAIKGLRHLMRSDLSRPGLLLSWASKNNELVVGDGSRLGGHALGISDFEFPNKALLELSRLLALSMSESLSIYKDESYSMVQSNDWLFFFSNLSDSFEIEWYERVQAQVESSDVELRCSRSELMSSIKHINVTASTNIVKLITKGNKLVLESQDENNQKSVSRLDIDGSLPSVVFLDVNHLMQSVESRQEELIVMRVSEKVIKLEDSFGWEVLLRREV